MELSFAKLHGLGNDFIFVDDFNRTIELADEQVARLCDRHFGIGADGVILVRPGATEGSAGSMHYINADGTLAQMCGNGVRCTAKYLIDRGFAPAGETSLIVDTLSGPKPISFETDDEGRMTSATVDMGTPILEPAYVPVNAPADAVSPDGTPYAGSLALESPWGTFTFACVSMGNPHAICFVGNWDDLPDALFADPADKSLDTLLLDGIGAFFESHPAFPEKTNVEFAEVRANGIAMRVFERGCGETLACGTGACATNTAAVLTGRASRENDLELRGGSLHIRWDDDGRIYMTGPATESFSGTVTV